jgi:hypothetical protein
MIDTTRLNHNVKQSGKFSIHCPVCQSYITFGVEFSYLRTVSKFPFAHVVLHGTPLHGLIVYIDSNFMVRGEEGCESIEVLQKSEIIQQLIHKWANPF